MRRDSLAQRSAATDIQGGELSADGANILTRLSEANLSGAYLIGANLSGADLMNANLSGALLVKANLSGAHLIGANLMDANLTKAELRGANLSGTNVSQSQLDAACGDKETRLPSGLTLKTCPF